MPLAAERSAVRVATRASGPERLTKVPVLYLHHTWHIETKRRDPASVIWHPHVFELGLVGSTVASTLCYIEGVLMAGARKGGFSKKGSCASSSTAGPQRLARILRFPPSGCVKGSRECITARLSMSRTSPRFHGMATRRFW